MEDIMSEKNDKIVGALEVTVPAITVTASGTADNIDREIYYPTTVPSGEIAVASTADLEIQLEPQQQEQLIQSVDVVKTYVSEMELALGPIKFKIKRSPRNKVIKSYKG